MNQEEQRKLAIKCNADEEREFPSKLIFYTFGVSNLAAYTAQVEAPLQARIAQLEEALDIARHHDYQGYHKGKHWVAVADKALNESPSTWLSQHDKEVEARVIERLCTAIKAEDDHCADGDYMMDSDDCISVVKGTWERPDWRGLK